MAARDLLGESNRDRMPPCGDLGGRHHYGRVSWVEYLDHRSGASRDDNVVAPVPWKQQRTDDVVKFAGVAALEYPRLQSVPFGDAQKVIGRSTVRSLPKLPSQDID